MRELYEEMSPLTSAIIHRTQWFGNLKQLLRNKAI